MEPALPDVVANSHRELRPWRRADAIRRRVIALCATPGVRRDFAFCDQANRAAASACRNIAEGFARYGHGDFARFLVIARSSLGELRDSLDEALLKRYLNLDEFKDFDRAVRAAMKSANELRIFLEGTPTPEAPRGRRQKPPRW